MTLSVAQHRQIRLHLAFIPVYVWIIWVWTSYAVNVSPSGRIDRTGHVKGQDFTHDYVLGQIAREHATGDLYNFDAQSRRMDRLFPDYEVRYAPVHGPQLSLLFAPLARMPYESALWVWLALSVSGYATCCAVLYGTAPRLRRYAWVVVVLAIGYPPFYFLIAFGQISVVGLACVTAAYLAFRARRPWLAGLALGTLAYKPPLGIAIVLVMVYGREWQVLGGAFVAAVVQLAAAAAYYGPTVLVTYADTVGDATQIASVFEPILHRMQSLRSFFLLLVPLPRVAFAAYVCSAAAVVIAAARYWTSGAPLELRYSVLLLATVLIDPHVNPYELIVIAPVFVLVGQWLLARETPARLPWLLLYLCYYVPALDFIPKVTHVQVSVVAFVALMIVVTRLTPANGSRVPV